MFLLALFTLSIIYVFFLNNLIQNVILNNTIYNSDFAPSELERLRDALLVTPEPNYLLYLERAEDEEERHPSCCRSDEDVLDGLKPTQLQRILY